MERGTIVVVEDEERIAAAVAARLGAEGFRVETAATGPDGVELCRRVAPDLVVLDWMLPGFDGVEACRQIQADRPVPVLFLTARDSETDVLVGLGIGADDYMTKPFSPASSSPGSPRSSGGRGRRRLPIPSASWPSARSRSTSRDGASFGTAPRCG